MITDDSLDNFLQVRGFPFRGMVGCSEASTHPTLTHATLAMLAQKRQWAKKNTLPTLPGYFNPCYARYI